MQLAKPKVPKEYLGAFKFGHRSNSREFVDDELAWKLLDLALKGSIEAKEALSWLTRFNDEYHKDVVVKGDPRALHGTDELRKDCHRRNYLRRNDLYTALDRVDMVDVDKAEVVEFTFKRKKKK